MPIFKLDGKKYDVEDRYLDSFATKYPEAYSVVEKDGKQWKVRAKNYARVMNSSSEPESVKQEETPVPTEKEVQDRILANKPDYFKSPSASLVDIPLGSEPQKVELDVVKPLNTDLSNYTGNKIRETINDVYQGVGFDQKARKRIENAVADANNPEVQKSRTESKVRGLAKDVETDLEDIENRIEQRTKALRSDTWRAGMPSVRDDNELKELRGQRTYLVGAKELMDESQDIIQAAKDEKDGTFVGGILRGFRDKAFDIDNWTMGLSDLVGGMRLKNVLEKSDKGEELSSAEQMLLDSAVQNMAVQAIYNSDLGLGYKAGQVTGESLPFMLEFLVNPISASGNAMAKKLLSYGLKRAGKANASKSVKAVTRLATDATSALGMTATTGIPSVLSETVNKLNNDYEYTIDDNGNFSAYKDGNTSFGEALGKSALTRTIENQSEMIFNAFKGASKLMKGVEKHLPEGVNGFMKSIADSKVGQLYTKMKNNPLRKELMEATQIGGIGEEYLEEVYNNLANFAIGEMEWKDVVNLDKNIETFVGLAPTQAMFAMLGLGGMGAQRYKSRRDINNAFGKMSDEQKAKLQGLQEMGKLSTNKDIAIFIRETMADQSLTPEERRAEIEYAYNVAKQNAINEIDEAEVSGNIESDNAAIDAKTEPSTGMYGEVLLRETDADGNEIGVPANVFLEKEVDGELHLLIQREGATEQEWVRPNQYVAESYMKRPAEEVKAMNEEMTREQMLQQADLESRYAPEVLEMQMQQGVPFETADAQYIPIAPTLDGSGWQVEIYAKDTNNKVAKQPTIGEMTNDEFRDMMQAQYEAQETVAQQAQAQETAPETEALQPVATEEVAESTSQPSVEETVSAEAVEEAPQAPVIPTKADGSVDYVAYGKENSLKDLGNAYGERLPKKVEVTAKAYADDLVKAQANLAKAEEALDNAPIGREGKAKEAVEKAIIALETAKKEADFWAEMDADIKQAQAEREALLNPKAEMDLSEEPMTVDEFVAKHLADGSIRLTSESYKKETGYGEKERKKFPKLFLKAENGGMSIEEAGEMLMQWDREDGTNFFNQEDANAGRDALINFLTSVRTWGDITGYIRNNREYQAERASEALKEEVADAIEQNYHMTPEEYATNKEVESVENPFGALDVATKDAIFVEAYEEYEQSLNPKQNDEGRTSEVVEGDRAVLSEERTDNEGRADERQGEGLDISEGAVQQNDAAQEGTKERPYQQLEGETTTEYAQRIVETERKKALRNRANEWAKALGIDVTFYESLDEVDAETRAEIEDAHAKGDAVAGWVAKNGKVYFFAPDLNDAKDIDDTYIHEVVAHIGLKKLLGEERFNQLCDKVWEMMPQNSKNYFYNYSGVKNIGDKLERQRAAADEYMASLAEKETLTPEEQTVWDKIVKLFKDMLNNTLNNILNKSKITEKDISDLIKMSYANLKSGVNGGVIEGKARFRFARTQEEFENIQKEAVKEKGLVMSGLNEAVLSVVEVPIHTFEGDLKEARAEAKDWAFDNYAGKEFALPKGEGVYTFSKRAINKYLDLTSIDNSVNPSIHLSALKKLPEIIESSIEGEIHADYTKDKRDGRTESSQIEDKNLLIHRMFGAINFDGKVYRVKTTMKEYKQSDKPNVPYTYEVTKIELIEDYTTDASSSPLNRSTNSITGANLLKGVEKSYDKGKFLLDESKKTRFRVVYHGSGAEFDKFDHANMGSGAGSQVFGWGTYVTESEKIGRDYADVASKPRLSYKGEFVDSEDFNNPWRIIKDLYSDNNGRLRDMRNAAERYERLVDEDNTEMKNLWGEVVSKLKEVRAGDLKIKPSRNLYEVEIPDEKRGNYIVWGNNVTDLVAKKVFDGIYERLSNTEEYGNPMAQKEFRNELANLKEAYGQGKSGIWKDLYGDVATYLGSEKEASKYLRSLGYVGIKYPAGTIFGGKYDGAHNYVIFNESDLQIVERTRFKVKRISNQTPSEVADKLKDCFYEDVAMSDRIAMVEYLQQSEDGKEVIDRMYQHNGTGWAKQTANATFVRIALNDLLEGREPSVQSMLTRGRELPVVKYIKQNGKEGVWRYIQTFGLLGEAGKPVNNVNGSFLSCNPSNECAKYCYATKGNYIYAGSSVKSELVYWCVSNDPVRAAQRIVDEYKSKPQFYEGKALRLFDKGDIDLAWLPVIEELNKQGVVTQVFSKRPEILERVDKGLNVVMMSIDSSNTEMLDEYPNMPIALVYRGGVDSELLDKCRERFQQYGGVILPVKIGQKLLSENEVKSLPLWTRPYQCPIDNGKRLINDKENPERSWNCTKCDKNGGVGCFFHRTANKLRNDRYENETKAIIGSTEGDNQRTSSRNAESSNGGSVSLHSTNGTVGDIEFRRELLRTLRESLAEGGLSDADITPKLLETLDRRLRGMLEGRGTQSSSSALSTNSPEESGEVGQGHEGRDRPESDSRVKSEGVNRFRVYKSKDGKETKYKQLSLFDERGEVANDGNRPDNLQRESSSTLETLNSLRELQEGEICNVERRFTESKEFSFTRGEKVESTADVAYIFKSLEDEAIENCFVAIANGDNVTVVHLGMGAQSQTVVDTSAIIAAVERLNADKVFFVHNHPSGEVKCSKQDVLTYKSLKNVLGDRLEDGIIINTRSGKYGLFNSDGLVDDEGRITSGKTEYPIKVYKFNKQAFNVDVIPTVTPSSVGIAEFVSTQRLGHRDKVNALLLNNQFGCVGNILIDNSKNMSYITERITNDAIAMGARQVVIYGRYPFVEVTNSKTNFAAYLSKMINEYSQGNVNLIDIIQIDEPYSKSANDEGVRFRIKREDAQKDVDEFSSKYNSKPVSVVSSEMTDEELEKAVPTLSPEDVRKRISEGSIGGYSPKAKKIYIFADNVTEEELEDTLFHENLHQIFSGNPMIEEFYNNFNAVHPEQVKMLTEGYEESEVPEESFVTNLAVGMHRGNFKMVEPFLSEGSRKELDNTLKAFGYDYEQERGRRNTQGSSGEGSEVARVQEVDERSGSTEGSEGQGESSREQAEQLRNLFERVAEEGLRGAVGDARYDLALFDVYKALPEKERVEVSLDAVKNKGGNVALAVDEYLNKKGDATIWDKVVGIFRDMLRKAGFDVALTENDVKYLIWRSQKPLDKGNLLEVAEDIDKKNTLKVGEYSPTYGTRFRVSNRPEDRPDIIKEYDKAVTSGTFNFIEAFQDRMYSLKQLMDIVVAKTGKKARAFEDAYEAENRMSSEAKIAQDKYTKDFYNPLVKYLSELSKKYGFEEVRRYIYAKSGLERNVVLRQRDADEAYNEAKTELDEKLANNTITQAQYNTLLAQADQQRTDTLAKDVDYSGLRGFLFNVELAKLDEEKKNGTIDEATYKARKDAMDANRENVTQDWKNFAEAQVAELEGKAEQSELDELWRLVNAATNETLRIDFESGMIDRATYQAEKNMMKYYVPLRNWKDTVAEDMYEYRHDMVAPVSSNQKRAGGRESEAQNPIATIALMAQNAIVRGYRNRMKQKFYSFVANRKTELANVRNVWYVKDPVKKDWHPRYADTSTATNEAEVKQIMEQFETDMEQLEAQGLAYRGKLPMGMNYRANRSQKNAHVVTVMINGKEYAVYVNGNPRAADAVNGLTNSEATRNPFFDAWAELNRKYGGGLTSWNPDFIIPNFVRDSIHATSMTFLDKGIIGSLKYMANVPKIFAQVSAEVSGLSTGNPKLHQYFEEFLKYGGETGYTAIHTIEDFKAEYKKLMNEARGIKASIASNGAKAFGKVAEILEMANRISEDVNRFNAYVTSREAGLSVEKSISDAKNITVNFNRKGAGFSNNSAWGAIAGFMSKWILFFNPSVQGIAQLMTKSKENPKRAIALGSTILTSGFFMPMLNEMLVSMFGGGDEDDYWNQSDYKRRNNWLIFAGDGYISIPLPPVLRELYGLGDIAYGLLTGHITPERAALDALKQVQSAIGFVNLIPEVSEEPDMITYAKGFAPDIAAPVLDVLTNTNFMGRPIAKWDDYNKYEPEYKRVYKGVSPHFVEFSKFLNEWGGNEGRRSDKWGNFINPAMMEHLITSYTGGIGKTINNAVGMLTDYANKDYNNIDPYRKAPILPRFYTPNDEKTVYPAINRKYYEYDYLYNRASKALKNYKDGIKTDGHPKWQKYIDEMKKNGEEEFIKYFKKETKKLKKLQDSLNANPSNKELERKVYDKKAEIANESLKLLK